MKAPSLRLSAMNFLAIREHSILELKNKLQNKFPDRFEEIEQLLAQLVNENLLSDERFAEAFIRSRMNKGYGPVKISYELTLKGISNAIIAYNIQLNDENWFASIQKAWNKKFSGTESKSSQDKIKQFRYLYQRGFNSDQIKSFIKKDNNNNNIA
jgi:regulatory protein